MKKFLGIILTCLMIFSLAACGGNEDQSGINTNGPIDSSVTLPTIGQETVEVKDANEEEAKNALVDAGFSQGLANDFVLCANQNDVTATEVYNVATYFPVIVEEALSFDDTGNSEAFLLSLEEEITVEVAIQIIVSLDLDGDKWGGLIFDFIEKIKENASNPSYNLEEYQEIISKINLEKADIQKALKALIRYFEGYFGYAFMQIEANIEYIKEKANPTDTEVYLVIKSIVDFLEDVNLNEEEIDAINNLILSTYDLFKSELESAKALTSEEIKQLLDSLKTIILSEQKIYLNIFKSMDRVFVENVKAILDEEANTDVKVNSSVYVLKHFANVIKDNDENVNKIYDAEETMLNLSLSKFDLGVTGKDIRRVSALFVNAATNVILSDDFNAQNILNLINLSNPEATFDDKSIEAIIKGLKILQEAFKDVSDEDVEAVINLIYAGLKASQNTNIDEEVDIPETTEMVDLLLENESEVKQMAKLLVKVIKGANLDALDANGIYNAIQKLNSEDYSQYLANMYEVSVYFAKVYRQVLNNDNNKDNMQSLLEALENSKLIESQDDSGMINQMIKTIKALDDLADCHEKYNDASLEDKLKFSQFFLGVMPSTGETM